MVENFPLQESRIFDFSVSFLVDLNVLFCFFIKSSSSSSSLFLYWTLDSVIVVDWLRWCRSRDAFETLCFMAVWVLWVVLETSAFQCHDICKKRKKGKKKREHLVKCFTVMRGMFSDTENGSQSLMQRPLGGDIYAGSRKVSNTKVQPSWMEEERWF